MTLGVRFGSSSTAFTELSLAVAGRYWLGLQSSEGSTEVGIRVAHTHGQQLTLAVGWELCWGLHVAVWDQSLQQRQDWTSQPSGSEPGICWGRGGGGWEQMVWRKKDNLERDSFWEF